MVKPGLPAWAVAGDREHRGNLISSIQLSEADLEAHNRHLNAKYAAIERAEQRADLFRCEDAELLFVACNTPSRAVKGAVAALRGQGVKAGLFRPVTLWPFPIDALRPLLRRAERLIVVEASPGQLEDELRLALSYAGLQVPAHRPPAALRRHPAAAERGRGGRPRRRARPWPREPAHERLLPDLRAARARGGPEGPQHPLLPGLRPRPRAQVPGRGHRRAPGAGPHRGHLARGLRGLPPLLPRRRQLAGRPRPGARGGHRPQARQPRLPSW